jgi:hypothetical protein
MSSAKTARSSELLQSKLSGVRDKHLYIGLGTGVAWLVLATVLLLGAGMFLDWKFDLSKDVRTVILMGDAVVLLVIFAKHIYTPFAARPDYEEVALEVERGIPEFRSRLIASTQMEPDAEKDKTAALFIRALLKQTEEMSRSQDFNRVVSVDGFAKVGVWSVLITCLGLIIFNEYQPDTGDLLNRAFLGDKPVPRKTLIDSIEIEPNEVVARGDDVVVRVVLNEKSRVKPKTADLAIMYSTAARPTVHTRTNLNDTYTLKLENVRETFTITAKANDGQMKKKVEVVPRPAVRTIEFEQKFPSYTGLKPQTRQRGDLTLLLGSELKIRVAANKKITGGVVFLKNATGETQQEQPLMIAGKESEQSSVSLKLDELNISGFSVRLRDKYGYESQDEAFYRVTMLPDKPPVVRILEPIRKEEKVTQRATLPIMVSVKDDYGVDNLVLMFSHGNSPPQMVPLKAESTIGRLARVPFDWKIRDLKPSVGTEIKYWVQAYDGRTPEPGMGKSRELTALVVTDNEKRRDLQNRATDSITGINETAARQEKLNVQLGEIIRARAVTSPQGNE